MKSTIALFSLLIAFGASSAFAADAAKKEASPAQKAQQEKMKACNADAKQKALKSDERKKFMSSCLGGKAETPGSNACATSAAEKKLAGAAKSSFMKKCEADAKAPPAAEAAKPAK
jgi:methanogenic corrinoid protein MtbC1